MPAEAVRRGLYACTVILVVLSVAFAVVVSVGELPELEVRFRALWILLAIAGMAAYLAVTTELWRRLLARLGGRLEVRAAFAAWFGSALGRYVPTGLLVPAMRTAIASNHGVPKRICLVSVVYELAMTLVAAVLIGAYFIFRLPGLEDEPARYATLAVPFLILPLLHPAIFHRASDAALRRLGSEPLPATLSFPAVLSFLAAYAGSFAFAGVSVYATAKCVDSGISVEDAPVVIGAFAVATAFSLVGFLLPGGLVVREAGMALALSPAMAAAPALAVAILSRILQIALELAGAIGTQLPRVRPSSPRP